jgi:hypothetical protein
MTRCLIKASVTKTTATLTTCLSPRCLLLSIQNSDPRHEPNRILIDRSVSNSVSAVDIYSLGVRVGFYLQSVAITIMTVRQF